MNAVLEEILRTASTESMAGEKLALHSAVDEGEGRFLEHLVLELKPKVSLEVGMAFGVSSLFICQALPRDSRHIAIDPNQLSAASRGGWEGAGLAALDRAGFRDRIEFYAEPSYAVLPRLAAMQTRVDFAFVDGWHTLDFALIDFFYADKMLPVGGVIAIDDVHMPSVRKLCRFVLTNLGYVVAGSYFSSQISPGLKSRLLTKLAKRSAVVRRIARPEFTIADAELGLHPGTRCVALKKIALDTRAWDYHHEF
jgi:predicted O-methyltransferase YrrM